MRILIYGAGVIGSLYAVLFAETGYDTSIYARGKRLDYYEADCPERAGKDWKIMKKTAKKLKRNFSFLRKQAGRLSPCKMNIFRFLPLPIMTIMLAVTFESSFGDKFMYQHARKAPDEMRELHKQFYAYMKKLKEARYEIL